ncbi:ATP phosphoribosyltransferase regulatory subunit [Megasphaera sueciensis]|jgi:ATP phosphoribosyltransferase regulatory subunit|uniref:ATP phosphoribosyltransferase regulatory subunit n=1 Tax=Megasphaera sueciensis TaxID=349094 RepID=UPI003D0781A4
MQVNNTLDGVKMLHHDEMRNYDRIQSKLTSVIMNHGCKIIETPSFEDYDVYRHFFPQLRQEMVKTIDTDGRVLVLRPDVTLPLVETAAREFPRADQLLKFGYVSTVFREYYGRSTYGKDFLQGGIEILGDASPECDGEVIVMAAEILDALSVKHIRIDIGTVAYTDALFAGLSLAEEQKERLRKYMAERNLVAYTKYLDSLSLEGVAYQALKAIPMLFGSYAVTLSKAYEYCINKEMQQALKRLEKTYDYILYAGYADKVQLDFGFASQLGYYTDMVFKVYVDGALYDVIDGGRYDTLSAQFGVDRPACGFGMNINLLYEFMNDAGLLEGTEPSFQLAISYAESDQSLIRDLMIWRLHGFRVAAYPCSTFIDSRDYSIHAIYENGIYYQETKQLTAQELEEQMRRL